MDKKVRGKIIKGVGGLYTVRVLGGEESLVGSTLRCRARGIFRHSKNQPLAGDDVVLGYDAEKLANNKKDEEASFVIDEIEERKNSLIRPPLANLDNLFVTIAAASPDPVLLTADKLFSICVYNGIEPVALVTKSELAPSYANEIANIYKKAGFRAFVTSAHKGTGIDELKGYIDSLKPGSISAFSGASGVGKSSIMNCLFPSLELSVSEISKKTERGKHTTRQTELFVIKDGELPVFLADTPGFSMLDFDQFDFFTLEDLPDTMRDFEPYIGSCKYRKCTHTKEEGCAILEAVRGGEISASRHESYLALYETLKTKKKW